ncbi:MAG TPA: PAS domain S-box protein [Verrucomicrobiae bacterium]
MVSNDESLIGVAAQSRDGEHFRVIIEQAAAGIVFTDLHGNFTYVNRRFCDFLGYSPEELLHLSIPQVTHPDSHEETRRRLKHMLATGGNFVMEKKYLRKDGSAVWATTTANALLDASGKPIGITGLIVDITDRKRAEEELTAVRARSEWQRRLYEIALSNTPDHVAVFDPVGCVTYANDALLRTWGRSFNDVIGKNFRDLGYPEWQAARHEEELRTVIATRQPLRREVEFQGADGLRRYDYIFAPILNASGEVEGVSVTSRDVTERYKTERALAESEQRFRAMADNIDQCAWIADHTGKIYWLNQRWWDVIGLSPEQMRLGESAVHPEEQARVTEKFLYCLPNGIAWEDTFRLRLKDGSYRWFLSRAVPIRENGAVKMWFGTNTDITELKVAEQNITENQQRLQAALRAANAGTFRWDIRTNSLNWDDALDTLFGIEPGRSVRSLDQFIARVHPDDQAAVIANCQRCANEGVDFEMEFRVVWPDSSIHWLYDKGKAFFEDGLPSYMTGACVEITDRKHAEFQTHHQRDILDQIVRGVPLNIILEDLTARVERIADRDIIASILLLEPDGVTLRPTAGRRIPEEWSRALVGFQIGAIAGSCGTAAFRGERVIVQDIATDPLWQNFAQGVYARKAIALGLRACWSTPILSTDKKVLGTFAVYYRQPGAPTAREIQLVDISANAAAIAVERKRSEQELNEARAKLVEHAQTLESRVAERTASLREAISQMEEFSYTVSHDLRAPLRGMQVYSEALLEDFPGQLPADAVRYLEKIQANSQRLDKMFLDVLTFSRLARSEVSVAPVNLDNFVRTLIQQYPAFSDSHAALEISPLHPVLAHEPSLTQALSNLLSNAIKFVPPGSRPNVRIRTEPRAEHVRLWVEDSGIGIPPEYQHRLFTMFERVHPKLPYDGTGVGLAIVRKAVERMNGRYGVESDGRTGSKFWIELKSPDQSAARP